MTAADRAALAERGASIIHQGFEAYHRDFLEVTRRAKGRFERQDWPGALADARERLDLYARRIAAVVPDVRGVLGERVRDESLWTALRAAHSHVVLGHPAAEIAETFFNSVTRRIFQTVGINPAIEYLDFRFERVPVLTASRSYGTYTTELSVATAVRRLLDDCRFAVPFADADRDAGLAAREIEAYWEAGKAPLPAEEIEVLDAVFYRRKGAYIVARVRGGNRVMPLVLALVHRPAGLVIDAVLLTEAEVSMVFSYTRSYFHADVPRPAEVIDFLRSLLPVKPVGELYSALGYHKHGKTELYRDLQRHLLRSDERFDRAPGAPGMVMAVFALPSFDVVFKVIRDTFPPPKQTTRAEVERRYEMVAQHDRAGRLVDAQGFEGLAFPRTRFARALLTELLETASRTVRLDGDQVVIAHLYTERRVKPLDLYLVESDAAMTRHAAVDYGQAVRDLAATGMFPGDLLLKNFGVTRHGRVVFYDYDEILPLSECRFREMPEPRTPEDELADEPWFAVGPGDVFPEELRRFIPFDGAAREALLDAHGCLFEPGYWRDMQARLAAGEILDVFPYDAARRLP
ncbi:MAG TPA: bifunctional isocitrate dehydrogenase kinase/phosphatase [Gemmatimonadales bacterium]|nr:bifunctional isocitrate dehydrogenase kinase/phosphatase [Gemmatimonadales bacterium]